MPSSRTSIPARLWNKWLSYCAHHSSYRHLVKDWQAVEDVNLAARVFSTNFFRDTLDPVPLPITDLRSIVVIAPHADDEAIGAGGSLLLAGRAGAKLDVLFFTDSMQGNLSYSAEESKDRRRQEAQEACRRLGATMHELAIDNTEPQITLEKLSRLSDLLDACRPDVIMVPWLLDYPVKHRLVNHALWLCHQRRALPSCEIWGYQVHNSVYPNGYVDITDVIDEKVELIRCHASQLKLKAYDHQARGIAAWNAQFLPTRSQHRYAELFHTLPLKEHLGLVETFYLPDLKTTYRGHPNVYPHMVKLHKEVTGALTHPND